LRNARYACNKCIAVDITLFSVENPHV
jgi:hypothetical protein